MSNTNYWHMQMHPNNPNRDCSEWILEHRQFIGLGQWDEHRSQIDDFIKDMKVNDIVVVRNGARLIALVQVIGGPYIVPENVPNNDERYAWMVNRRPVRVLAWDTIGRTIPQPRGALNSCKNKDVRTTKIIKGWHEAVVKVMQRRQINLTV